MVYFSGSLSSRNSGSKYFVLRGAPHVILPTLWKAGSITHPVFEKDTAGYAAIRDKLIKDTAVKAKIKVIELLGRTLCGIQRIVAVYGGNATLSASAWQSVSHNKSCTHSLKCHMKGRQKLPEPLRPSLVSDPIPLLGDIIDAARLTRAVSFPVDLYKEVADDTAYSTRPPTYCRSHVAC